MHTAISDLEVQQVETSGHLWHFRYPIEGEADRVITVATTRPETMLGDTAVAVHPDDDRYKDLVGKNVVLPLVGRLIPIVADDYADPQLTRGLFAKVKTLSEKGVIHPSCAPLSGWGYDHF